MLQFEIFVLHYGYAVVFLFLPIDITILGVFSGTIFTYTIGRTLGKPMLIKYGKWLGITHTRFSHAERWFNQHSSWAVTFGYFIPQMRHLVCSISGVSDMSVRKYLLFATLDTCISCIICVTFSYLLRQPLAGN